MATDGFILEGDKELEKNVRELAVKYPVVAGNGLYIEGSRIMGNSQKEVPVDRGRLRATGFVTLPEKLAKGMEVTLGYGTNYAIFVHEDLEASHTVGKAKYLLDPFLQAFEDFYPRLGRYIEENAKLGESPQRPSRGQFPTVPQDK